MCEVASVLLRFYRFLPVLVLTVICLGGLACAPEGHFKGIKVVYMAGGNPDHFFARILANGAQDAAKDLGVDLTVVWSGWDKDKILLDFKKAISEHPDGIALVGYPDEELLIPFVDEAMRKGIVVTSQNVDRPAIEAAWSSRGFGYVGQNVYASGQRLAREAVKKSKVNAQSSVAVFGVPGVASRGQRSKGILDELDSEGIPYTLYNGSPIISDMAQTQDMYVKALAQKPHWDLVLDDINSFQFSTAMEEAGISPDAFFCAGFDVSEDNAKALKKGYIDLLLDQQPYLQGYLPVLQCAMTVKYGFAGLHILTDASLVDRSNLELIEPWIAKGIR